MMATPVSVSALAHLLKSHVGEFFGDVHVSGEISNFTAHRSGHWYFAIKDQGAVINCAMFRGSNARCRFQPRTGDQVVLNGGMDMYAPQGRLNLIVRSMREDGAGDLQRQLEELKKRLSDEGLFDPAHKQPLPGLPQCIGVATSPTGAAFQDILKVLSRRFPGRHVLLSPCKVQGDGSAAAVVQAIERLVADGRADVIIFGRGGGSPEDLMAFNDESLARAILACPVPTISAVGHEVDVSISDLVADVRAATPSHAAELVVPERDGILAYVDELGERLSASVRRDVEKRREKLAHITLRTPEQRVADGRLRLDDVSDRLYRFTEVRLTHERSRLVHLGGRLDAMSPLRVLERGYAVVQVESGAVTAAAALKMDDQVRLRFHDGERQARITDEA